MGIPDRSPQIIGVTLGFLVTSWIVILLRCYTRIRISKSFFLDDWLIIACMLLFSVYSGYGVAGAFWGAGRHISDLPPQNIRAALKVWYFCIIFYAITACTLRVTVGIFLLRLVPLMNFQRALIITLNVIGVISSACYLAQSVFQCISPSYFWQRMDPGAVGYCFDPRVNIRMTIATTVIATVTDWTFGLLPIWILWHLQMNRQRKIVVCALLALGILACTAPIIRIPHLFGYTDSSDFLWSTTDIAIWSVVELGIGIIVISLPSLGPLFRNIPFFAAVASGGHGVPVSNQTISTSSWRAWRDRKMSEAQPNALDPPTRRNSETSRQDLDIYFSDRGLASQ